MKKNARKMDMMPFSTDNTHLWKLEKTANGIICNTGSITFPKGGNLPLLPVMKMEKSLYNHLNGEILKELPL